MADQKRSDRKHYHRGRRGSSVGKKQTNNAERTPVTSAKKSSKTTKTQVETSAKKSKKEKKGGNLPNHIVGKVITVIQLILSIAFTAVLWSSGMAPLKYIIMLIVVFLLMFAFTFGLQHVKSRLNIIGIVLSVLISVILAVGTMYLHKANKLLEDVGGASYKTDNMVVVVKDEDPAEELADAKDYRFGIQKAVDQENTQKMIDQIEKTVDKEINVIEYESIQEEAQALLDGKVEAAIYNEALAGILTETIEDYEVQVKVLYQYGIDTVIEEEEPADVSKSFNIYISGIDVAGAITTNSRSDVNIIMSVNPETKKILLTTTPRDYYVPIPGISGGQRDKLTHAGIYGVDASMSTLEELYGIDISYYARVNFTSLVTIVDALGGVDVNSEYDFSAGGYHFNKGVNHLNGKAALAFSRERYSFAGGDNQRGKNQEAVLTAILQKATSPAILTSANEIISSVSGYVETNMSRDDMAKFINMQLSDPASWEIISTAASGKGDSQSCYSSGSQKLYVMWPDESVVATIKQQMADVLGTSEE